MSVLNYVCGRYQYKNDDSVDRVLQCVTGSYEDNELLVMKSTDMILKKGSLGAQMESIQNTYRNEGNLGKRIIHSVIRFDEQEQLLMKEKPEAMEDFLDLMSHMYHSQGYQNVCSIHQKNGEYVAEAAINSVSFISGEKMVCNHCLEKRDQEEIQRRFDICFEREESDGNEG